MLRILILLPVFALTSCAMISNAIDEKNAKAAQEARVAEAKQLADLPFSKGAFAALGRLVSNPPEVIIANMMARLGPGTTAKQALSVIATSELSIAKEFHAATIKRCSEQKIGCDTVSRSSGLIAELEGCVAGNGKDCALRAVELENSMPYESLQFAKKACVLGNQGGCSMVREANAAYQASQDRAIAAEAVDLQRRRDNAAIWQNAFSSSQGTTCTSQPNGFGGVTTNCR